MIALSRAGSTFLGSTYSGMAIIVPSYDQRLVFSSWRKVIENGAKTIYPGHDKPFDVKEFIR